MEASSIEEAASALAAGRAALFPTDTVYGLGVAVGAAADPALLYELKGRPSDKPIAWLVGGAADLDRYGRDVPDRARKLAEAFWPGPLTLIVRAGDAVPPAFRSAAGTIGLRMPDHPVALALIRAAGVPLATTSANPSGAPAPRTLDEVDPALAARVGAVVRDAAGPQPSAAADPPPPAAASGVASTVLDCTGASPVIVRQGALSARDIDRL